MEIMDKKSVKKLVNSILELNPSFCCVGLIDNVENTILSKMNESKNKLITNTEEEGFAADLQAIKIIQDRLNKKFGVAMFSHVIREKIQELIYNIDNITIYVTCESNVDHNTIVEISRLINDTINECEKIRIPISK